MTNDKAPAQPRMGRVAAASAIGTVIEFYDFTIFGTAAALVFSKVFFPALGTAAATAVALATFSYRALRALISAPLATEQQPALPLAHANVRGGEYFR